MLAGAMPRSGGEYVYNGRVLHPAIGFMTNWGFTWSQLLRHRDLRAVDHQLRYLGVGQHDRLFVGQQVPARRVDLGGGAAQHLHARHPAAGHRHPRPAGRHGRAQASAQLAVHHRHPWHRAHGDRAHHAQPHSPSWMRSTRSCSRRPDLLPGAYNAVLTQAKDSGYTSTSSPWSEYIIALPLAYWMFIGFTCSASSAAR